jgi:hypothetical protein
MKLKIAALAGALALVAAIPGVAEAATWWGYTTTNANFRATPGGSVIGTIPANARVHVVGQAGTWDRVSFSGQLGYVSASLITSQYVQVQPRVIIRGPAPTHGYVKKPWWDNQHQAWYDGRRWYRNGIWYSTPNFSFGLNFGG